MIKKIIVDIVVSNCQIIAAKPALQIPMGNSDVEKMLFWNTAPVERFNQRVYGDLEGAALRKAEKIVNKEGGINISGEYGSIKIDESEFIPFD